MSTRLLLLALAPIIQTAGFLESCQSFDPDPSLKSPPVAPPHWVPHPSLEVARMLERDPNAYELLAKMTSDLTEVASRWWDKTGQFQEELDDERVPLLLRGVIPPLPRDAPVRGALHRA